MTPEPISCEESLRALAKLSAAELESSRALTDHLSGCADCNRVATVVLERERALSLALDSTLGSHERRVAASLRTETIEFSCLTPQQAESLIEPYVRTNGHGIYFTPGIKGVTVRALPAEIARSRQLLRDFDLRARMQ